MTTNKAVDYGWRGRLGIGTPQGNPTVEAEMRRLIPPEAEYYTLRLTSDSERPGDRLTDYLEQLPSFMRRYARLKLDAFLFACTGSSYLLPSERAYEAKAAAEESLGAPVILAADAIRVWLDKRKVQRLCLLSPYPDWLNEPALQYWQRQGFDVVEVHQADIGAEDTYAIYDQQSFALEKLVEQVSSTDADAYLVSGTGMPSLPVLKALQANDMLAVSSNLALAEAGLTALNLEVTPSESWWFQGSGGEEP